MRKTRIGTIALLVASTAAVATLGLYVAGTIPYRVYVVHTGSMSPTIPSGSAVIVEQHRYRIGQVITFREHGETVTHRLVAVVADGTAVTKGDANRSTDPWRVAPQNIVGGVVLAPHWLGFALVYLRTPPGAASIVLAWLALWQAVGLSRLAQPASGKDAPTLTITSRST